MKSIVLYTNRTAMSCILYNLNLPDTKFTVDLLFVHFILVQPVFANLFSFKPFRPILTQPNRIGRKPVGRKLGARKLT